MRDDILIDVVQQRCMTLKRSGVWAGESKIRPAAWLNNFEVSDRKIAALLLDRFVYCNDQTTDRLLVAAWEALGDGLPKSAVQIDHESIAKALSHAVFTPVEGESPNPTDSGNFMCRKARQVLGVPDERIMPPEKAVKAAERVGAPVVFLDDFVGSGDQFVKTWKRNYQGTSFSSVWNAKRFTAIYVTLVTSENGLKRINEEAPGVVLSPAHVLSRKSSIYGLIDEEVFSEAEILGFLRKYSSRLRPMEAYIARYPKFLAFGYHTLGYLLGFEHSIPDATLPIFWSPGEGDWEPLIERL